MKTTIKSFVFNSFGVNTYVIFNDNKECIIIDPACYAPEEGDELSKYIDENELSIKHVVQTHGHVDHYLGIKFIYEKYGIKPIMHVEETLFLDTMSDYASMFGFQVNEVVRPEKYIDESTILTLGDSSFQIIHLPGHSPGSIGLYNKEDKYIVLGDVLFHGSIGRTDLPKGDYDTLINSIKTKVLTLPDDTRVLCGHGDDTTVCNERIFNPFLV